MWGEHCPRTLSGIAASQDVMLKFWVIRDAEAAELPSSLTGPFTVNHCRKIQKPWGYIKSCEDRKCCWLSKTKIVRAKEKLYDRYLAMRLGWPWECSKDQPHIWSCYWGIEGTWYESSALFLPDSLSFLKTHVLRFLEVTSAIHFEHPIK